MNLKDLNLNKVIGREAILQGSWSVNTSDGQSQEVWVGVKSGLLARIIVKVDGTQVLAKRSLVVAGQLAQFELGGDIFAVRHSGIGLLGKLDLVQNGRGLSKPAGAPPGEIEPAAKQSDDDGGTWETWIEEAERFSEPLGDEVRVIDNTRSTSETERKITVSRQWSQTVTLEMDKATELEGRLDLKLPLSLGFSASAKQSITRKYAISEGVTRTYSEEVTITVMPKTLTTITFGWKQIWQGGIVVGRNAQGMEVRVPFEVKLHPTFDQTQEDVKNESPSEGA